MSEMLDITPGDAVLCNMTQLGEVDWFIGSKIVSSGKETNTRVTKLRPGAAKRLLNQPWAYNTLECYGCTPSLCFVLFCSVLDPFLTCFSGHRNYPPPPNLDVWAIFSCRS